jgi:hypothetical protein
VAGCCEHDNELLGSIKGGELFETWRRCWLLKKDSASWSRLFLIMQTPVSNSRKIKKF